jgi:hypothetical protein
MSRQGRALRCRGGLHRWVTRVNKDVRWVECGRCGSYANRVATANRFPPGGFEPGGSSS